MGKSLAIILIIIVLGFAVYTNSFQNKFLFDDIDQIVKNTAIRSFANIQQVFTHHIAYYGLGRESGSSFFRPIQSLTLMSDYFLWGLDVIGYHLTNTILHILVAILLFFVAWSVTKDNTIALLVSILYLVHPVHTEAVTYVSGRADPLSAIFLLLMVMFAATSWQAKGIVWIFNYLLTMACFLLGLLSKESAIIFPFLLLFFEYCNRKEDGYSGVRGKSIIFYLSFVVVAAAWLIYKSTITPIEPGGVTPLSMRLIALPRVIWDYIRLSVIPVNLHMEYKFPVPKSIFQAGYFEPLIVPFLFLGALFYFWKKGKTSRPHRTVFFGLGWFIIALLPFLNVIIEINAVMAEHWLYIAEMGFILAVVSFTFYCVRKSSFGRKVAITVFAAIAIAFSGMTVKQNAVWKDTFTFFTYTVKVSPHSATAYNNLALSYIERGDRVTARKLLERAVKVDPSYSTAAENLEQLKAEMGQ